MLSQHPKALQRRLSKRPCHRTYLDRARLGSWSKSFYPLLILCVVSCPTCLEPAADTQVGNAHPGAHESLRTLRAAFADLGVANPQLAREIIDAVVERLGGCVRRCPTHANIQRVQDTKATEAQTATEPSDLVTDRSPLAELLYQRCRFKMCRAQLTTPQGLRVCGFRSLEKWRCM